MRGKFLEANRQLYEQDVNNSLLIFLIIAKTSKNSLRLWLCGLDERLER